jgi:hypothetical protein
MARRYTAGQDRQHTAQDVTSIHATRTSHHKNGGIGTKLCMDNFHFSYDLLDDLTEANEVAGQ